MFLSAWTFFTIVLLMPASGICQKSSFTVADDIIGILRADQILTRDKQSALEKMVSSGSLGLQSLDTLDEVLSAVDEKIKKDLRNLDDSVTYLTKLRDNRYAQSAAVFKNYDLQVCANLLEELKRAVEKSDSLLTANRVAMTTEDYTSSIKAKVRFLLDSEDAPSVPGLWKLVKEKSRTVYGDWNGRYQELKKRFKSHSQNGPFKSNVEYNFDEAEFMSNFNDLQALLRLLCEAGSKEF